MNIKELSKILGLGVATVSDALNGKPLVSDTTRRKVIKAALKYGYVPNRAAMALRKEGALTVGVIFGPGNSRIDDPFYAPIFAGVVERLSLAGRDVSILNLQVEKNTRAKNKRILNDANSVVYSAIKGKLFREAIVIGQISEQIFRILKENDVSVVYAGNYVLPGWVNAVCVDIERASRRLIEILKELGYEGGIHFGTQRTSKETVQCELWNGLRKASERLGFPIKLIEDRGDIKVMERELDFVGNRGSVICGNELLATISFSLLLSKGRKVPDDVGIVSFGNTFFSTCTVPQISTMDFRLHELGVETVNMLLMGKCQTGDRKLLIPQFVMRNSLKKWK